MSVLPEERFRAIPNPIPNAAECCLPHVAWAFHSRRIWERPFQPLHRQVLKNEFTDRQRIALVAELKGMPHAEIATSLGVTRNAVYTLTQDARKPVQAQLQAAGISAQDILWAFE